MKKNLNKYIDKLKQPKDNDISIKDEPYYHVMVDYFGGTAFEIYAQLEVNDGEVNE